MKKLLIIAIATLLSLSVFGQKNTYIGFETTITNDVYDFTDEGDNIKPTLLINILWGINIRQDINNIFSLESGLIRKYYKEGLELNTNASPFLPGILSNAINVWQIPLRIKSRFNIYSNKYFFTTNTGFHYCINSDYGSYGSGHFGDSTSYVNYASNTSLAKSFFLLETGGGFEFIILQKVLLSLSCNYFTGFRKIVQLDIEYTVNNEPLSYAYAHSKGDYWSVGIGLRYKINDFWLSLRKIDKTQNN
jgi:hypothetical protein